MESYKQGEPGRVSESVNTIERDRPGGQCLLVKASHNSREDPVAVAPLSTPRYFARQMNLHGRGPVTDVRFVGEDHVDGTAVWVIWYQLRTIPFDSDPVLYRTEWIEKESLRLLRQIEHFRDPNMATWESTFDLFYPD